MGLSFFENMAGRLVQPSGESHPLDVELKCEATHLTALAQTGLLRLTGVVRALPWAHDAALDGTLRISPVGDRCIEYDIRFRNGDGRDYRLFGQKNLHWRNKLFGMTELFVGLWCGEEKVAEGLLTFDLNDLPSFATSVVPHTSVGRLDLTPTVLDANERALVRAFGEAVIAPGHIVPPVDDETVERAEVVLSMLAPHVQSAYKTGLRTLDVATRARFGRPLTELPLEERRGLVSTLESLLGRQLTKALSMPIEAAHFGRRDYLDALGVPDYRNPVREPRERWMSQVFAPGDLEPAANFPCDVVVVGTGAGGAPVAAILAERGYAVALVEEGRYYHRPQYSGSPEERLAKFWRDGGINLAIGNSSLVVPTGRMVGGSTAINSGTCFDPPDAVLAEWRAMGFPEDFEPANFRPYIEKVRRELQVETARQPYLGEIANRVARGAEALRELGHELEHGPLPRNAPGCDGQGLCAMGCPTGAKRSSDVSWVPRALKAGAYCFTGMSVKRILRRGGRAVGIEARGQDEFGRSRVLRLEARVVVLACGTLQTPLVLADSGFDLPRLGRGLSVHPALGALAMFDEDLGEPWKAIPQSYGVEGLVDERVRFEGFSSPPSLTAPTLPFHGEELTRWMENIPHVGQYGFMVRDPNDGVVQHGLNGRPLIRKSITPDVLKLFIRGSAALAEMLLLGGAEEVATGIEGVGTVRSLDEARAIADRRLKPWHFRSMAFHPLGTCAMGASSRTGVVGFDHRVFGTHNVYVVDGSSVPTSLGVNPQITIMSMALRAADILDERLNSSA